MERMGEWENGRRGEWENGRMKDENPFRDYLSVEKRTRDRQK
jgi:hypothetical protein